MSDWTIARPPQKPLSYTHLHPQALYIYIHILHIPRYIIICSTAQGHHVHTDMNTHTHTHTHTLLANYSPYVNYTPSHTIIHKVYYNNNIICKLYFMDSFSIYVGTYLHSLINEWVSERESNFILYSLTSEIYKVHISSVQI